LQDHERDCDRRYCETGCQRNPFNRYEALITANALPEMLERLHHVILAAVMAPPFALLHVSSH
jgi:hypothetical protein